MLGIFGRAGSSAKVGSVIAAITACAITAAVAVGDTIDADIIGVANGTPTSRDLGTVAAGATLRSAVSFQLSCAGNNHVDDNQVVTMSLFSAELDNLAAGTSVSVTSSIISDPPTAWPEDGSRCGASPPAPISDTGDSVVTITAPTTPGLHTVVVKYAPSFSTSGSNDSSSIAGSTSLTFTFTVGSVDGDGDGIVDANDNCPTVPNPDQANNDGDTLGDACDPDDDNDTIADGGDNCPTTANTSQANLDGDAFGDACDTDRDGDGRLNGADNCPSVSNADQSNIDGDGFGDACDPDIDGDGALNGADNCPNTSNADQADLDGDNIGNACDSDIDGDGALNGADNCQLVSNADQANLDGDALGDACDPDIDNDGHLNEADNCPRVSNADQADADEDGQGAACDDNDNRPVVGIAAANANGNEGATLTTSGSFTDADPNSSLTVSQASGVGDVTDDGNGHWSWSHATSDDGSGSVTVRVSDGEHDYVTDTFDWTAVNVAPTTPGTPALSSGSSPNNTGRFSLSWSASTDVSGDTVTYTLLRKDADDGGYSIVASGLSSASYTFGSGNAADEGTWTYKAQATDGELNGTSGQSGASDAVKVDKTKPSAPNATTTPSSAVFDGWFKDTVTVTYDGSTDAILDDGSAASGVAGYTPASQTFSSSGSHAYSGVATDNAGNVSAATASTLKVDATSPTVTIAGCPTTQVILGSTQSITVAASDAHSGLVSNPTSPVVLDTSTVGSKTRAIAVEDNVGHTASATCAYGVIYNWTGFFQPIDNDMLNSVQAGRTVPAKFSLGGNQGLNILSAGLPSPPSSQSYMIACSSSMPIDGVEESTTAVSGLKYDALADQYIYNWSTQKAYAGTCRKFILTLADGTQHIALFKFTK